MSKKSEGMHLAPAEVAKNIKDVVGSKEGNHLIIEKPPDKILMVSYIFILSCSGVIQQSQLLPVCGRDSSATLL